MGFPVGVPSGGFLPRGFLRVLLLGFRGGFFSGVFLWFCGGARTLGLRVAWPGASGWCLVFWVLVVFGFGVLGFAGLGSCALVRVWLVCCVRGLVCCLFAFLVLVGVLFH